MPKKVQRKLDKWKSKEWYQIEAPKFIGDIKLVTTPADDSSKLIGRVVEITLGDITNDFTKHNIKMKLEIDNVKGNVAHTKFIGHEITSDYLRSIVKRQTSRIDNNLIITTKDGYVIVIKPICFTLRRARTSQIKAIRALMGTVIEKRAAEINFEEFINDAMSGKLSANIYRHAKYIYPIRRVEIKKTEIKAIEVAA